ncbi:RPII140-upstream gene protein [Ischnura elegans]|uniref:RPII140-upstream gene protein n=1 Tax=Ischnura elegans TaxID=197161 RepID=UPI001ED87E5D|nr:RPII140-upstream gene protein [Ischnura elegans]
MENILSQIIRRSFVFTGILPVGINSHDHVSPDSQSAQEIISREEKKTGLERVRAIFTVDEFDNLSPELTTVVQGSILGMLVGACYGGINRSKVAYLDFITKNQATQFASHLDAKKKLQDQVTIGLARGGFQWGWRLGVFTGSYLLISSVVATYRGKSGILEHEVSGVVTGGLYKASLGARGVIVGSGLGAVLGGLAGITSYGLLKVTGYSMEEIMTHRKYLSDSRQKMLNEKLSPYGGINEDPLVQGYMARHESSEILPKD